MSGGVWFRGGPVDGGTYTYRWPGGVNGGMCVAEWENTQGSTRRDLRVLEDNIIFRQSLDSSDMSVKMLRIKKRFLHRKTTQHIRSNLTYQCCAKVSMLRPGLR